MNNPKKETPVMKQFRNAKKSHPDSIMLFRMGDFYETFENDAKIASKILGITLTKRANGAASSVPLFEDLPALIFGIVHCVDNWK